MDLSGCISLKILYLPIPIDRELLTGTILPSISSSVLSNIDLFVDKGDEPFEPQFLAKLEKVLWPLAKRFSAAHGGTKMEVEISIHSNHAMFAIFQGKYPMPRLIKEAKMKVYHSFVNEEGNWVKTFNNEEGEWVTRNAHD